MALQKEDKDAESGNRESEAFEDALKTILNVPKAEIERREAEQKAKK